MIRKALFLRTIFVMKDYIPIKTIIIRKVNEIQEDIIIPNVHNRPVCDILNTSIHLGLLPYVRQMTNGTCMSKSGWKKVVWDSAWAQELNEWDEYKDNRGL